MVGIATNSSKAHANVCRRFSSKIPYDRQDLQKYIFIARLRHVAHYAFHQVPLKCAAIFFKGLIVQHRRGFPSNKEQGTYFSHTYLIDYTSKQFPPFLYIQPASSQCQALGKLLSVHCTSFLAYDRIHYVQTHYNIIIVPHCPNKGTDSCALGHVQIASHTSFL